MGTFTPNLNLYKPANGELGWGDEVDANFDTLDRGPSDIRFVATSGDDSNSGTTWGNAKLTVKAAIDALPAAGGKVYFQTGCWANADHTKGLWFTTSAEPGWITAKPLHLEGVAGNNGLGLSAGAPVALLNGPTTMWKWEPSVGHSQLFENIAVNDQVIAVGPVSFVTVKMFRNCSFRLAQSVGNGPVVSLGDNCYWWWFEHCVFITNEQESYTSDLRCAIFADGGSASTPGLIHVHDCLFGGGSGIRVKPGPTGGLRWSVRNVTTEGATTGPDGPESQQSAFELVNGAPNPTPFYGGYVSIDNVTTADALVGGPAVKIVEGISPDIVHVSGVENVQGPATVHNVGYAGGATDGSSLITPREANQQGFDHRGYVTGKHDAGRRSHPLAAVRYANLATQDTSVWGSVGGSATVTTLHPDPFGGTNAGRLTSSSGVQDRQIYRAVPASLVVGDRYVGGVICRTDALVLNDLTPIALGQAGGTGTYTFDMTRTPVVPVGRKQWTWVWFVAKLTAAGSSPPEIIFSLRASTTVSMHYALPLFFRIPDVDQLSDAEVYEIADHFSPWSDVAAVGDVALPIGTALSLAGTRVCSKDGTPENAVVAPLGSLCMDTTNGELYVKKTGTGDTGWKLVTHA